MAAAAAGQAELQPAELGAAYGHMCLAYCDQQQPKQAAAVLKQAKAVGAELPASELTWVYSRLIHTFGREKQLPAATAVFGDLEAKLLSVGEKVPQVVYRRLIDACAACGAVEKCFEVVEQMEAAGEDPRRDETLVAFLINAVRQVQLSLSPSRLSLTSPPSARLLPPLSSSRTFTRKNIP